MTVADHSQIEVAHKLNLDRKLSEGRGFVPDFYPTVIGEETEEGTIPEAAVF